MNRMFVYLVLFLTPLSVMAADDEPQSMIGIIVSKAGWAGWATVCMSVVAFTLVIKLFMDLRRDKVIPGPVESHIQGLIEDEDYEGAVNSVSSDTSFLGRVLFGGLAKMNGGPELVTKGADEAWEMEMNSFMQVASYVNLAAQLAPMMGLFGTVSGMMEAFSVLATSAGAANPKDLAQGIMYALVTTFIGLLVAIPCNLSYLIIKNKITTMGLEISVKSSDLLDGLFIEENEE